MANFYTVNFQLMIRLMPLEVLCCFVCSMPLLWTLYTYKAHRKSSGFFYSVVFVSRGFTSSVLSVVKNLVKFSLDLICFWSHNIMLYLNPYKLQITYLACYIFIACFIS